MGDRENIVLDKSYRFAIRIVKMDQHLSPEKKEYILRKQVLRSGTSMKMVSNHNLTKEHLPSYCNCCGNDLSGVAPELLGNRQVVARRF
jgi:hypothetical protein